MIVLELKPQQGQSNNDSKKQVKEGGGECVVMKKEEQIEIAHLYEQTLSAPLTVDAAKPIIWSSTFRFPIGTHAQGVVEGQGYQ